MNRLRRIGILGGTFDPFHLGHLAVARAVHVALALDEIRIVPSSVPPHRPQPGASVFHRFAMAALGIASEPGLLVDDIEALSDHPSYTATTLARLQDRHILPRQLFFITGADAFAEIATWRDYPRVLNEAHFVVVSRRGQRAAALPALLPALASRMQEIDRLWTADTAVPPQPAILLLDAQTPELSSTAIRQRASAGLALDGLVPPPVARHIERHWLYRIVETSQVHAAGPGRAAKELHGQDRG